MPPGRPLSRLPPHRSGGLNDRPWFPVATIEPGTHKFLTSPQATRVHDVDHHSGTQRFAVATVAGTGLEKALGKSSAGE